MIFAIILYKKFGINKNAIYFLLGIVLTFATLTIPLQFNGNYITLFWSAEGILLLWLSRKSKIAIFKLSAIIVQVLMLLSLLIDWNQFYTYYLEFDLEPFYNKIFVTGIFAMSSIIGTYRLLKNENKSTHFYFIEINPKVYSKIAIILSIIIGYLVGMFEVYYQAFQYNFNYYSAASLPVLYHFIFSLVFTYFLLKNDTKINRSFAVGISAINIFIYIKFFSILSSNEILINLSENTSSKIAFYSHYILLISLVYFIYILIRKKADNFFDEIVNNKIAVWVLSFCMIFILSNEVMIHRLMFTNNILDQGELLKKFPIKNEDLINDRNQFIENRFSSVKSQVIKIGYPILWGLLSFIFLIVGIKKQKKSLRIIALSLLGLTILKLFLYDINNVSKTGKIIAFILLGIIILIISFVYQKVKKPSNK